MNQAYSGLIPQRRWIHDLDMIKNCNNQTLREILRANFLPVPYHWNGEMSIFDQACFGIIPDIKGYKSDE